MIMLVELESEQITIPVLQEVLNVISARLGVQTRVQHEAIFTAMHWV